MTTRVDEVADGIYRISTFIAEGFPGGLTYNQYLIDADEALLFSTGLPQLFPEVLEASQRVLPTTRVRWISSGHGSRPDEFGSIREWLGAAPHAQATHGAGSCLSQLQHLAGSPRVLEEGEVIDLGGKRVRYVNTPFVQGAWESGMLYEETTGTLFCGDLLTCHGEVPVVSDGELVDAALELVDQFGYVPLTPSVADIVRELAGMGASTLALMHGPAYVGNCARALEDFAAGFEQRVATAFAAVAR